MGTVNLGHQRLAARGQFTVILWWRPPAFTTPECSRIPWVKLPNLTIESEIAFATSSLVMRLRLLVLRYSDVRVFYAAPMLFPVLMATVSMRTMKTQRLRQREALGHNHSIVELRIRENPGLPVRPEHIYFPFSKTVAQTRLSLLGFSPHLTSLNSTRPPFQGVHVCLIHTVGGHHSLCPGESRQSSGPSALLRSPPFQKQNAWNMILKNKLKACRHWVKRFHLQGCLSFGVPLMGRRWKCVCVCWNASWLAQWESPHIQHLIFWEVNT